MNIKQVERAVKSFFGDEIEQIEGQEVGGSQVLFSITLPYPNDEEDLRVYLYEHTPTSQVIDTIDVRLEVFR